MELEIGASKLRRWRRVGPALNAARALGVFMAAAGGLVICPSLAQVIDAGAVEVISGQGDGTRPSPWDLPGFLIVGQSGAGTLSITNGGTVTSALTTVGLAPQAHGTISVTGPDASWVNTFAVIVGELGHGELTVAQGASVSNGFAYLGGSVDGAGQAFVRDRGSHWSSSDTLTIGRMGHGALTIGSGGEVLAPQIAIALESGSTGVLQIGAQANADPVEAGLLDTATISLGAGTGALVFNHTTSSYAFGPDLVSGSGRGALLHLSGDTRLIGDGSGFDGQTTLTGGRLFVAARLGGDVHVEGGTLGGAGAFDSVTVNAGVLAPGDAIGTLSAHDVTFNENAVYQVQLREGGNLAGTDNDWLDVGGAIAINGGTIQVSPKNGTDNGLSYTPGTTYTIMAAADGISGSFAEVADDFAYLDFVESYGEHWVTLTSQLAVTSFCSAGMSQNQCSTGNGAFALGEGALFSALLTLPQQQAPTALDMLSGEVHASLKAALVTDAQMPIQAALAHSQTDLADRAALWVTPYRSWSRGDRDANVGRTIATSSGAVLGVSVPVTDQLEVGIFGAYGQRRLDLLERSSAADISQWTVGAMAKAQLGAMTASGGAAFGWHDLQTRRAVRLPGFGDTLLASYGGQTSQLFAETSWSGSTGAVQWSPFAQLAYLGLASDGFEETGDAAALIAQAQATSALLRTVGMRAQTTMALGADKLRLTGMVGYRHAEGLHGKTELAFADRGDVYEIAGQALNPEALVLQAGVGFEIGSRAQLAVAYDGELTRHGDRHSIRATLRGTF